MTISAHGARRVWGGASLARNIESGTSARASMFYELNPHLRKKGKVPSVADKIKPWLAEHGPASAAQVADGIKASEKHVCRLLQAGVVGVVVVTKKKYKTRVTKIWGVEDGA